MWVTRSANNPGGLRPGGAFSDPAVARSVLVSSSVEEPAHAADTCLDENLSRLKPADAKPRKIFPFDIVGATSRWATTPLTLQSSHRDVLSQSSGGRPSR